VPVCVPVPVPVPENQEQLFHTKRLLNFSGTGTHTGTN
jgi:hypothetical protein